MTNRRENPRLTVPLPGGALVLGALFLGMLGVPAVASSQVRQPSSTISSDRPGLGDGAYVLAPGVWQAELGGTIQADRNDEWAVGSSLLRIGFDALELRVFLPDVVGLHRDEFLRLGDLSVGVKVPMATGATSWRWAATGAVSLPTGAQSLSARHVGGSAAVIGETSVTESVGLALNVGYGAVFNDLDGGTISLIATPTFAVPGRDDLSLYAGYAGFIRQGEDAHVMELGFAKLDGADRQWDVNAGYDPGLNTWFLGFGVAQRKR